MVLESAVPPGGAERHFSAGPVEKGEMLQFGGLNKGGRRIISAIKPSSVSHKGMSFFSRDPYCSLQFPCLWLVNTSWDASLPTICRTSGAHASPHSHCPHRVQASGIWSLLSTQEMKGRARQNQERGWPRDGVGPSPCGTAAEGVTKKSCRWPLYLLMELQGHAHQGGTRGAQPL